jgi:fluoroquinolone transport system ATP-binding protein
LHGKRKVDVEYGLNGDTKNKVFELDGLGEDKNFLSLIKNERIASIHSMEATLDEIFIQVTGKTL